MSFSGGRSLSVKFLVPLSVTIILILAVGGFLLQTQLRNDLQTQTGITLAALQDEQTSSKEIQRDLLESKADIIGRFLVNSSAEFLLSYDYMTVESLKKIAQTDPEIAYVLFLHPDGTTIDGSPIPGEQPNIKQKSYPILNGEEEIGQVLMGVSQSILQKQLAESERRAGEVQDEVKTFGERTLAGVTLTMVTIYGLLLIATVLLVSLLFRRMVIRPLHQMVSVFEEMGLGQLGVRLNMVREDEIGRISRAMDEMADKLENTVRRIDTSTDELVQASESISVVTRKVNDSGDSQAQGVADTHSAVRIIDASVERITEGMRELVEAAAEGNSSILEMSATIDEVAGNADALSSTAEEVGSSIGEIVVSIRQIADNSDVLKGVSDATASSVLQLATSVAEVEQTNKETAKITEQVRMDAEQGKTAVDAVISGMGQIRSASGTLSSAIAALSQKTEQIGSVLEVINDVTDQTSLLALNAAIIAAQAGEQGKSFGVVAQEIRDLSERTGASTSEIAAMIKGVRQETERAVHAIQQTEQNISEGEALSHGSGEALAKIVEGIRDVDHRMERITHSTLEQAQGARMIKEAMGQVADMVAQTSTAIQEQRRAAELIQTAAESMREMSGSVRVSTREQSTGSKLLVKTIESINDMAQEIDRACEDQRHKSSQIMQVVEEIRRSSESNMESTKILRQAVETQNKQIFVLREEVNFFKIAN